MFNKKLLVAIAKLLKIDEKVFIETLEKEDGDESILKAYTDTHNAYTLDELAKLLQNSNKQYLEKADFDINEVPKPLYSKIAAAAFESKEKSLAKEHNIEKYDNLQDLLTKVIESKSGKGMDDVTKQQIETLKGTIKTLEQEKETAVGEVIKKYEGHFIEQDLTTALNGLPFDYEKEAIEKQKKLLQSAFGSEHKLIRKENKTIVLGKDDKPVVDKLGDAMNVSDVIKGFATEYGFKFKEPDQGGRGTESSKTNNLNYKGITFDKVLESKGLKPNTAESDAAYTEWASANKN